MQAKANIEQIAIRDLTPWAGNARAHSRKQIRQIAESIKTFGLTNPVLIDERKIILAGHGRVKGAKLLGLTEVPCLRLDYMNEDEKRAYVLADNKLALNAGWDDDLLAAELGALMAADLDFDVGVIGFSIPEIDSLMEMVAPEEPGNPEDDVMPTAAARRAQVGDIWQLGAHRLVCGDALDPTVIAALMDGESAGMVFSDPPYNVPIDGHAGNSGKIQHREFAMASGEMNPAAFTEFLQNAFRNLADHSVDGSIHYLCMDWRHMSEMLEAGQGVYDELKNLIVWAKDNGGMGTFYRSRHELIFVFKKGTAPHINTFELGQHGRYRTNVWQYRGVNTMRSGRMEELALHPTVKSVQMIADAIRDVSARGDMTRPGFTGECFVQMSGDFIKSVQVCIEGLLRFLWRDVSDGAVQPFRCPAVVCPANHERGVVPVHPFQGFPFDPADGFPWAEEIDGFGFDTVDRQGMQACPRGGQSCFRPAHYRMNRRRCPPMDRFPPRPIVRCILSPGIANRGRNGE